MKTTKITIKNLFGIRETTLDGKSVEISGPKGSGKTSVLDAIRYALTNRSDRDYIVHQGADEGEIIIETNTGLSIDRKALPAKSAGTVKVRDGSMLQTRPAEFLAQIFTPLQLDPVKFTQLSRQEKNREILNLIEFQWDMNWIKEQFGEIPQGVDYGQHILEVLNDIQAENGIYFQSRQNINRDIRNKQAFIADIAKDIPSGYDYDRWNNYPSGEKYRELERLREQNSRIERAKAFRSGYDAKLGAEDIDDGVEPVLTIAGLWYGSVTLQRGKENKDVLSFTEERVPGVMQVRPLIVNSTNRKTLRKLFGDAKASTLVGKQIQLFVDHNVRDPQDGGMTDGIRIRPYKPRVQKQEPVPPCTDCGQEITPAMGKDARWLAGYTIKHYGVPLCAVCAQKRKEAAAAAETQQEAETAAEMQQELDPEHIQVDPETGEVL